MHSMSSNSSRPVVESRGISRRTLVKGAAHAAWVVPAVQLVTVVPAFAVSGCNLAVTASSATHTGNNPNASGQQQLSVNLTIKNTQDTGASNVTVVLTFTSRYSITTPFSAPGWTVTRDGNVFTFVATAPLAGGATTTLNFTAKATRNPNQGVPTDRNVSINLNGQRADGKGSCTSQSSSVTVAESGRDSL
jgi:hypothetical protein